MTIFHSFPQAKNESRNPSGCPREKSRINRWRPRAKLINITLHSSQDSTSNQRVASREDGQLKRTIEGSGFRSILNGIGESPRSLLKEEQMRNNMSQALQWLLVLMDIAGHLSELTADSRWEAIRKRLRCTLAMGFIKVNNWCNINWLRLGSCFCETLTPNKTLLRLHSVWLVWLVWLRNFFNEL